MEPIVEQEVSRIITAAVDALSVATDISQITKVVAETARKLSRADGTTFVLKDDDKCFYADEDAIAPLWKGHRFPLEACISGWSMIHREIVCIPDIYKDERIPHLAYKPTFVKSLCMVPIRSASPIGAIGNYWASGYQPTAEEIKHLQILADCASVAVENWELKQSIERRTEEKAALSVRYSELELTLHTLVHDLRNPMSSILAFSELLQSHMGTDVDSRANSYFESINRTANRVNQTIGQMLALYKLTSREIQKKQTDLSIIAMELEAQFRMQEPGRDLKMCIDEHMMACADPLLIRVVIENLLINAFKFTSQKDISEIHFGSAFSNSREQKFFVRDNGIGFNSEDAEKLFKPLSRLHGNAFSGTGLGLASVAQIVGAHGGRVKAESHPQQGAVFYFSLPTAFTKPGVYSSKKNSYC